MEKKRIYYKSFDENLCGMNGFQYEVGKAFMADTDNTWHWLHFATKVSETLRHYGKGIRICEVEPLGRVNRYYSWDINTDCLYIIRELSKEEILEKLAEEKCRAYDMRNVEPPYEFLNAHRDLIKPLDRNSILYAPQLTAEQKKDLLPKCWAKQVDMWELHDPYRGDA